ncbi:MAG: hypothetical protein WAW41_06645 [Methylobacter sp.]
MTIETRFCEFITLKKIVFIANEAQRDSGCAGSKLCYRRSYSSLPTKQSAKLGISRKIINIFYRRHFLTPNSKNDQDVRVFTPFAGTGAWFHAAKNG